MSSSDSQNVSEGLSYGGGDESEVSSPAQSVEWSEDELEALSPKRRALVRRAGETVGAWVAGRKRGDARRFPSPSVEEASASGRGSGKKARPGPSLSEVRCPEGFYERAPSRGMGSSDLGIGQVASCISDKKLLKWRRVFKIPTSVHMIVPRPEERADRPPAGCTAVWHRTLYGGVRFPLPEIVSACLRRWELPLGQVHPNSWARLIGLLVLLHQAIGYRATWSDINSMYIMRATSGSSGWFYLTAREGSAATVRIEAPVATEMGSTSGAKELTAQEKKKLRKEAELVHHIPESIKGPWKENWFWVDGSWKTPLEGSDIFRFEPVLEGYRARYVSTGLILFVISFCSDSYYFLSCS